MAFRPFRTRAAFIGNQKFLCLFLGEGAKAHALPHGAEKYRREAFPEQDKLRLYEEYGWKYAAAFGEYFHIYTAEEGMPEIHTDPIVESELYHIFLPQNRLALFADIAFWFIFIVLYAIRTVRMILNGNAYQLVHRNYSLALWIPIFMTLVNLPAFRKAFGIQRIRKRLASGSPLSHDADWRGKLRHKRWLTYFCGFLAAVSFFPVFLDYSDRPMAKSSTPALCPACGD